MAAIAKRQLKNTYNSVWFTDLRAQLQHKLNGLHETSQHDNVP